jgi:hypothetical protein
MLWAIGMTRQMRRMIRHESIITALIGAALGLPLGVFLAALVTRGLSNLGVGFHQKSRQVPGSHSAGTSRGVTPARCWSHQRVLRAFGFAGLVSLCGARKMTYPQTMATNLTCLSRFRSSCTCAWLRPFAPALLHKCSILGLDDRLAGCCG